MKLWFAETNYCETLAVVATTAEEATDKANEFLDGKEEVVKIQLEPKGVAYV